MGVLLCICSAAVFGGPKCGNAPQPKQMACLFISKSSRQAAKTHTLLLLPSKGCCKGYVQGKLFLYIMAASVWKMPTCASWLLQQQLWPEICRLGPEWTRRLREPETALRMWHWRQLPGSWIGVGAGLPRFPAECHVQLIRAPSLAGAQLH